MQATERDTNALPSLPPSPCDGARPSDFRFLRKKNESLVGMPSNSLDGVTTGNHNGGPDHRIGVRYSLAIRLLVARLADATIALPRTAHFRKHSRKKRVKNGEKYYDRWSHTLTLRWASTAVHTRWKREASPSSEVRAFLVSCVPSLRLVSNLRFVGSLTADDARPT